MIVGCNSLFSAHHGWCVVSYFIFIDVKDSLKMWLVLWQETMEGGLKALKIGSEGWWCPGLKISLETVSEAERLGFICPVYTCRQSNRGHDTWKYWPRGKSIRWEMACLFNYWFAFDPIFSAKIINFLEQA